MPLVVDRDALVRALRQHAPESDRLQRLLDRVRSNGSAAAPSLDWEAFLARQKTRDIRELRLREFTPPAIDEHADARRSVLIAAACVLLVAIVALVALRLVRNRGRPAPHAPRCDARCAVRECASIVDSSTACAACTALYVCNPGADGFGAARRRAPGVGVPALGPDVVDLRPGAAVTAVRVVADEGVAWSDGDSIELFDLDAVAEGPTHVLKLSHIGLAPVHGASVAEATAVLPRARYYAVARVVGERAHFESRGLIDPDHGCVLRVRRNGVELHWDDAGGGAA